jgi:hypothetical protein
MGRHGEHLLISFSDNFCEGWVNKASRKIRESEDLPGRKDESWEKCLSLVVTVNKKGIFPGSIFVRSGFFLQAVQYKMRLQKVVA